ncbi:amidohydrolase [Haloterrigena sp. SYSU A558-1]|uniref:Amidohydrolase n=1 Tax=Haloterrigena gelatinilytica TaxID=2741724 RepID=A0ABX2L3W2_9EURY|nr:amidohydrolase family protein [Haloterrigena gelatinilytica]NUC70974.1 amidohydrolase [Haloterrigena gelatinilytica]
MPRGRASERRGSTTSASRRRVLSRAGAGLLGAAGVVGTGTETSATAGTEPSVQSSQETAVADQPLFDAHTHLIPAETLDREPLHADDLVSWMDAVGIDRAVVLALDSPESYPVQAPSWWILEQVAAYPDRLVPFCTVDPRTLVYEEDFSAVTNLLERYVERGARGFGELKAGLPVDDARHERLYELCAEHGLPVVLHLDDKTMLDAVGLPRFENVLASFPDVDFVGHAHGWWAHISADVEESDLGRYPERPVEPGGRVPELLARYDNVYGDLSGLSGWTGLTRDPEYGQAFLETHHEQLLFGTDYLHPDQETPQLGLFDRFDLSGEAWANVRYRNLEGLLGEA